MTKKYLKLYVIDTKWIPHFIDDIDYKWYEEIYFRYAKRNWIEVLKFWIYVLIHCSSDYGFAWVNKAS